MTDPKSIASYQSKMFAERFTGRAEAYATSRPSYPREILDILAKQIGFDLSKTVSDVGSGTGILSKLFLDNGNQVYGVEPNDEMRALAEKNLGRYSKFTSINGTAEDTKLPGKSIDLVTVGQALHWFDPVKASKEFVRILRSNGYVCIAYNDRNKHDSFMNGYEELIRNYENDRAKVPDITGEYLSRFFNNGQYSEFVLSNKHVLDFQGLLNRITSASYMPGRHDRRFHLLKEAVKRLFDSFARDGAVNMIYDTSVLVGQV